MNKDHLKVAAITVISCYAYFFLEWLFLVTKPSFFNVLTLFESLAVLAVSPLPLVLISLLSLMLLIVLDNGLRQPPPAKIFLYLALTIPAIVLAAAAFMLVENFTYTFFGFNVGSFQSAVRYLYVIVFFGLCVWTIRQLLACTKLALWERHARRITFAPLLLIALSTVVAMTKYTAERESISVTEGRQKDLPNILVLSSDGVNANRMSAYGYERETTPFIKSMLKESLVFENAFTNAEDTTGSIGALLSAKLPTRTRVIYRPDTFRGRDTFQHFPGVLRKLGYRNADISMRFYVDAYDINMRDGFHYANSRRISGGLAGLSLPRSVQLSYGSEILFLEETGHRIGSRVMHAFGLRDMVNPYTEVTRHDRRLTNEDYVDVGRITELLDFIDESPDPFFAHVHFMGTHGPYFTPRRRVFSKGLKQVRSRDPWMINVDRFITRQRRTTKWMDQFYDDAILDYDRYVQDVVERLKSKGRYNNTIIVLTSDHGIIRAAHERLPLIIRFPGGKHAGRISANAQRIDVVPTILDFLGVDVPDWMDGRSLISNDIDPLHPIISTSVIRRHGSGGWWVAANPKPPYFSLGAISIVQCHMWSVIRLEDGSFVRQPVEGHTAVCGEEKLYTETEIREFVVSHLRKQRYDVSAFPELKVTEVAMAAIPESDTAAGVISREYDVALSLQLDGRTEESIPRLERIVKREPGYKDTLFLLGWAHQHAGRRELAINAYQRFLPDNPDHVQARLNLGIALRNSGKCGEAVPEFQRVLSLQPMKTVAHLHLAACDRALGDESTDEKHAAATLEERRRIADSNPEDVAKQYGVARELQVAGRTEESLSYLERIESLEQDYKDALFLLGWAHQHAGRRDLAINAYKRFLRVQPGHIQAGLNLGIALTNANKCQEAVPELDRVLSADRKRTVAHLYLATCHQKLGNQAKAAEHTASYSRSKRAW